MNAAEPSGAPALPWPLLVMDFEASSLDQDGYPIEVGLAFWPGPDHAILGWSTLIQPAGVWSRLGHWSPKSAKVHGIAGRDLLACGQPAGRVAAVLNEALGPGTTAWCDGGAYDSHWAGALFKAAGIAPCFVLGDWHRLLAMLGPVQARARIALAGDGDRAPPGPRRRRAAPARPGLRGRPRDWPDR